MCSKKKRSTIDIFDIEELGASICGIQETYEESDEVDDALQRKFGIDINQFEEIIREIVPRMKIGVSPLTNRALIGFCNEEDNLWLLKRDCTGEFISEMVAFISEGEVVPDDGGFKKVITKNSEPEYELTIKRVNG